MYRRAPSRQWVLITVASLALALTACPPPPPQEPPNPFEDPEILKITARRHLHMGEFDLAIQKLRKARTKAPDDQEIAEILGFAYIQSELPEEAIEVLSDALDRNPRSPALLDLRGLAYIKASRFAEAVDDLELALDPKLEYLAPPTTWARLAEAYWGAGRREKAVGAYRKAVVYQPRTPLPRISLVRALEQMGQMDQALVEARALVQILPDYAPGYFLLGRIQAESGQSAAAIRSFRRNLELAPASPDAGEAIRYIERLEKSS